MKTLSIATRKSPLALWQAEHVKSKLLSYYPEMSIKTVEMITKGDKKLADNLSKIGGKGLFIKELELGMRAGLADMAVHSIKDIPYKLPSDFIIGAVLARENPFDAFVSNNYSTLDKLPKHAKVGTSSLRRAVQLKHTRSDLNIINLRGNINTRLKKLDSGNYDAIILACAGLLRLGFEERISSILPIEESIPAAGQGAIGIEIHTHHRKLYELLTPLRDVKTTHAVYAERAVSAALGGHCHLPIAAHATFEKNILSIVGLVGHMDGRILKAHTHCYIDNYKIDNYKQAQSLGAQLAENLIKKGAKTLLQDV